MINQMEPWIGEEERRAVDEYLTSGGWLTEFKKTQEFEEMIADYVGSKYCIVLSNGTVTLFTALMALGIGPGDEVIVPDYTMIASANVVVLAGARPVFVDIRLSNLCLDLELVAEAFTPRTRAIMLVSLNGRAPGCCIRSICYGCARSRHTIIVQSENGGLRAAVFFVSGIRAQTRQRRLRRMNMMLSRPKANISMVPGSGIRGGGGPPGGGSSEFDADGEPKDRAT